MLVASQLILPKYGGGSRNKSWYTGFTIPAVLFFFPEYYVVVTSQPCLEQPHHLYLPVKCMAGIKI